MKYVAISLDKFILSSFSPRAERNGSGRNGLKNIEGGGRNNREKKQGGGRKMA